MIGTCTKGGSEAGMGNVVIQHITKIPGVCGGRACIAGHRIRVADIVVWHDHRGYTPDEIVGFFPGLTLADIHAALAYYFDHRQEIEEDLHSEPAPLQGASKLRAKLNG